MFLQERNDIAFLSLHGLEHVAVKGEFVIIQKALSAPTWLTSGSIYQINPRTFSAEGTISAVTRELPFLADLGFGTIYLCPIFEEDASENRANWSIRQKASETNNPKNPYRMNDYFRIDEEYGTMEDLAECIRECHRLGMHLILDLVYYHIGPNAPILKTHPEFAKQNADGSFINGEWNFPVLDFNNRGLREYLYANMIYYIAVLDADGFRCDIGDFLPQDFWAEGRTRICAIKPDACLILEGGNGQYLLNGFHAIYGGIWHSCVYHIITGNQTAAALRQCWEGTHNGYPYGARILRDIDNHDTVTDWPKRVECLAGHRGMDLILALQGRYIGEQGAVGMAYESVSYADVFRSYDVLNALAIPTTLDRVATLLPQAKGYVNGEDECYINAALGCAIGVMRSKCCKDLYLDDGDTRAQRLDEVTASLKWQRIAPPFIGTSVECSEEILFDGRFFEVGSTWCGWVFGREARQGAPAVIARNLSVDSVRVNGEIKPYVAVSLNPNGAYSVTIQPRLIDGISRYPDAVVTCDIPAGVDIIGVLGVGCDLRLHLSCVPSKVYVQSLLADEAFELTEGIEGNTVTLTAELARRIFGGKDLSAPALMLKIL